MANDIQVFNPLDPELCESDIEFECFPPYGGESFIVYTDQEASSLERQGYSVFPFPRN